jgi:hypothetical protein
VFGLGRSLRPTLALRALPMPLTPFFAFLCFDSPRTDGTEYEGDARDA